MEEIQTKIPENIFRRLKNAKINTIEEFLTKSKTEICNATKISTNDVNLLTKIISETTLKTSFTTVLALPDCEYLQTGCSRIDELIKGISTIGITEIYGESGCGKTQISLQLALQVQKNEELGGLSGGCIYVCTEDIFPSKRLHQLKSYFSKLPLSKIRSRNYEDNIFIEHVEDVDQLKHCLTIRIPILILKHKIRLIIIDSIAGAFRYDNEAKNYISRSEDLTYIAQKLNDLSNENKLAVLCINQVTSDLIEGDKPCLGLAWTNLVRTRLEITRTGQHILFENQTIGIRRLKIIFSPFLPVKHTYFLITKKGVNNYD